MPADRSYGEQFLKSLTPPDLFRLLQAAGYDTSLVHHACYRNFCYLKFVELVVDAYASKGAYDRCEVCSNFIDICICPECEVCGNVGDPNCYKEVCCDSPSHRRYHGQIVNEGQALHYKIHEENIR